MVQKFNLKKMSSSKDLVALEKQIINKNKEFGTESIDDSGSYAYRLKAGHKDPAGDALYESILADVRTSKDDVGITEAEMNKSDIKPINGMDVRSDKMNKTPLMDYSIENDNKLAEKIKSENNKEERDTSFWDKGVGSQMLGEKTVIVSNDSKSQLVSNYKTREEFEKVNKMAASTLSQLKDADALLYSIFRKASDQRRELTKKEEQIVLDINSGKIRILGQFDPTKDFDPQRLDQDLKSEQDELSAEDKEEELEELRAIDKALGDKF